jgi:hypothetical protein
MRSSCRCEHSMRSRSGSRCADGQIDGSKAHLDVHEVVHTRSPQLWELQATLLQERSNVVSLLCLIGRVQRGVSLAQDEESHRTQ